MKPFVLQLEQAGSVLLDYGVIGVFSLAILYFAWQQYVKQQKLADDERAENKELTKKHLDLSHQFSVIAEKQTQLQAQQMTQTKEFYDDIKKDIDELPAKVAKEAEFQEFKKRQQNPPDTTPQG